MCQVLGISPSGYYAAQNRPPSQRERADYRVLVQIRLAHRSSGETYGARRMRHELRAQGVMCVAIGQPD